MRPQFRRSVDCDSGTRITTYNYNREEVVFALQLGQVHFDEDFKERSTGAYAEVAEDVKTMCRVLTGKPRYW